MRPRIRKRNGLDTSTPATFRPCRRSRAHALPHCRREYRTLGFSSALPGSRRRVRPGMWAVDTGRWGRPSRQIRRRRFCRRAAAESSSARGETPGDSSPPMHWGFTAGCYRFFPAAPRPRHLNLRTRRPSITFAIVSLESFEVFPSRTSVPLRSSLQSARPCCTSSRLPDSRQRGARSRPVRILGESDQLLASSAASRQLVCVPELP